jgi:hypothetical protein
MKENECYNNKVRKLHELVLLQELPCVKTKKNTKRVDLQHALCSEPYPLSFTIHESIATR